MLEIFVVLNGVVGRIVGMYGVVRSGLAIILRVANPILGPSKDLNIVEPGVIDNSRSCEYQEVMKKRRKLHTMHIHHPRDKCRNQRD